MLSLCDRWHVLPAQLLAHDGPELLQLLEYETIMRGAEDDATGR